MRQMADHAAKYPLPVAAPLRHLHLVQRGQPVGRVRRRRTRAVIACWACLWLPVSIVGGVFAGPVIGLLRGWEDVRQLWRRA